MEVRPNTAPGGKLKSKFVFNRTNASKEIEAWVRGEETYQRDAVRMSGQLTDNVTEERMLRAKLWELSRERYKFLSQNAYERKVFVDRIQRKSSALRRSLLQQERVAGGQSCGRKVKSSNARLAMLDRLDPTRSRQRLKEFKDSSAEAKKPGDRPQKSVQFGHQLFDEDKDEKSKFQPRKNLGKIDGIAGNPTQRSQSASVSRTLPDIVEKNLPDMAKPVSTYKTSSFHGSTFHSAETVRSGVGKRPRVSSTSSYLATNLRCCTDPRIVKLESSLAPVHSATQSPDVSTIVKQIGSLHLPPKINKETTKPKTTVKILDHMRAIGLIV